METIFKNKEYYLPGKKVLSYFIISRLLPIILIFGILGVIISSIQILNGLLPLVLIIGIILCIVLIIIANVKYIVTKFMLDDFSFHIQKGILSKIEIAIPYKQIQNVNLEQSIAEKMWGIAEISIETAGTDESDSMAKSEGIIHVLDATIASSLEKELLKRSEESTVKSNTITN